MKYLLQNDNIVLDKEIQDIKNILNKNMVKNIHSYKEISENDLSSIDDGYIPIGTLSFVQEYLNVKMTPIEIPYFLMYDRYLNRNYKRLKYNELPRQGREYIKDTSILKLFNPNFFDMNNIENSLKVFSDDYYEHEYIIQDYIDILAEYRIFVHENSVVGLERYDECDFFSFPDENIIQEIISKIKYHRDILNERLPSSYTIDVAIDTNKRTCLLEIHNFVSCGTYGFNDSVLLYMYKNGIDYELKEFTK